MKTFNIVLEVYMGEKQNGWIHHDQAQSWKIIQSHIHWAQFQVVRLNYVSLGVQPQGIEITAFFVWGDSVNHWATTMPWSQIRVKAKSSNATFHTDPGICKEEHCDGIGCIQYIHTCFTQQQLLWLVSELRFTCCSVFIEKKEKEMCSIYHIPALVNLFVH